VEQLSTLRAIPRLTVIRPADAAETAEAWRVAVEHTNGPVALVLTRQKLGFIDRENAPDVARGAYVLRDAEGGSAQVVLMSSGSEVALIMRAQQELQQRGIRARVVSMPSHELFLLQSNEYQAAVLPPDIPRVAIEAAHPMSWHRFVAGRGTVLGITRFGASAPYERIFEELALTANAVVEAAADLL
jgi:transketolase